MDVMDDEVRHYFATSNMHITHFFRGKRINSTLTWKSLIHFPLMPVSNPRKLLLEEGPNETAL